mgnify:FL=1
MITFNAINHAYPGEAEQALTDLSLEFGDSTVTALVGPNGSGKTTLMQILAGLLPPSSGSVSINGTETGPNDLLGYSVMASSDRDFDNSSSSALVAYASLRQTWDQKLFDHYVQRFDFQLKGRKKLRKMSSGQAAILTATVALASGAPITVLDEIQAPMDVPTRYAFYEELLSLAGDIMEGRRPWRTFLISSHMVSELENVAEDVVALKNGRLLAHESVDEFTSRICAITGNAADVERFLADHSDIAVITSRALGSAREVIVDLRGRGVADHEIASHSLTSSPCSFQDAFAYLIQENDQ